MTQGEPIYVPAPSEPAAEPAAPPLPLPLPPASPPEVCGPAQTAPGGCAGLEEIKADLADLREAIAAIKPVPGPIGPPGLPGSDGKNAVVDEDRVRGELVPIVAAAVAEQTLLLSTTSTPAGPSLSEADVRRIVSEELAKRPQAKPAAPAYFEIRRRK